MKTSSKNAISSLSTEGKLPHPPTSRSSLGIVLDKKKISTSASQIDNAHKAQRAAMLKIRFAETILKSNPEEKENLERLQQEEKLKMEEQIKEEKLKMEQQMKEEKLKMKTKLEQERKAAREALEEVARTVYVEDNFKVMRDFERLINAPPQRFF